MGTKSDNIFFFGFFSFFCKSHNSHARRSGQEATRLKPKLKMWLVSACTEIGSTRFRGTLPYINSESRRVKNGQNQQCFVFISAVLTTKMTKEIWALKEKAGGGKKRIWRRERVCWKKKKCEEVVVATGTTITQRGGWNEWCDGYKKNSNRMQRH